MKKILITSIGSLVGQNILDALAGRRGGLHIIGTNSVASATNNFRCDSFHMVSPVVDKAKFISELIHLIKSEKPDVIVPGRDDDIEILAAIKSNLFPESEAFLCGSVGFAQIMDDKVKSYRFSQTHQLPFAKTIETGLNDSLVLARELVAQYGFPLIAKPKSGNGSRGIWVVTNEGQLSAASELDGYAIQPLIGHENIQMDMRCGIPFIWEVPENSLYATQVLISAEGQIMSSISYVSTMVMGKCEKISKLEDRELSNLAHAFAQKAIESGWVGPLNIQYKKDPKLGYQVIEMNGRFSGGTSARLYIGFDEVRLLLNHWLGEELIPKSPSQGISNTVNRSLVDFPVRPQDVISAEQHGSWQLSDC